MMTKHLIFLLACSLLVLPFFEASAQSQGKVYQAFQDATVTVASSSLRSPWCGGINSVQVNHADLNQDGVKDLVLYDQNTNLIKTFINTGGVGEIKYTYNPLYEENFPVIYNYLLMRDYNCDGVPDLFHKGMPGVSVHKGYYQGGELKFTFYKDLYFAGTSGPVNVYVQPDDIPAIQDVDDDGDIDVCSFDVFGNRMTFVQNMRVEQGLPCDSMKMEWVTDCYGKFTQGVYRSSNLGVLCKGTPPAKKKRHTGNCIVLLDLDADHDLDFLGGNISFSDVQAMYNGGSSSVANYTTQDTTWNALTHVLNMPSWPAPFHIDIDNDGDKDLVITSHNDNAQSANYNAVAWYKNTGTDLNPNFVFQHDSLLTPDMIDLGSYSYPVFFDYDKDGRKDLFLGSEGVLNNATLQTTCRMVYYRNTSTATTVSFELMDNDFLNLSANNYHGIFPTFGDLTGDGIDDLVFGNKSGYVSVYKNYASSNVVTPNFLFFTDSIPGISAGAYSFPLIYDFNQDGRTDLLLGNQIGKIIYYEDTSTTALKKLSLQTISLGNLKAGDVSNINGYCAPFIGKMDETNKEYLVIGNIDGTLARYDNFINNLGTFTRIDSNYSEIKTGARSVPAIADLNNDGKYEMVIGNRAGGLTFYRQVKNVLDGVASHTLSAPEFLLYPNPAGDRVYIVEMNGNNTGNFWIELHDMTGKIVLCSDPLQNGEALYVGHLPVGLYLASIHTAEGIRNKKLMIGTVK